MMKKDDVELENAFQFKEYVPSGRFASQTKSSINRFESTKEYMMDLVKEGGHPSLMKVKGKPKPKTNDPFKVTATESDGKKNVFQTSGQQQMDPNS